MQERVGLAIFFWGWVGGGIGFQSLFWRWLGWCRCLFWACWGTALFELVAGRAESTGAGPWVTGGMGGPPMGAGGGRLTFTLSSRFPNLEMI